ncbi:MAG: FAD-dependent oxidoreductase [Polyangia bacterium]
MPALSRRALLAATAGAWAAGRARAAASDAAPGTLREVDVAIVGAGAAGIAAARRILAAGRRCVLLEGSGRIGGRCVTDLSAFGGPFDRGAHWLHRPTRNPLVRLARELGLEVYPAPPEHGLRIGARPATRSEHAELKAALLRAHQGIDRAAEAQEDRSLAQALPADLGSWQATVEFLLGPFDCAREAAEVSAQDFAESDENGEDAFCRRGYGTLLARLADGLPVRLGIRVGRLTASGRGVELQTSAGALRAGAAIVTASTAALLAGGLRFEPEPVAHLGAAAQLQLGSYDHIVLELPGNPLGLRADELVFEKAAGPRTAALLANVGGTALCQIDVAGRFGHGLAAAGEQAMIAFGRDWLAGLFGSSVRGAIRRAAATRWDHDPWARGAYSAAAPGAQAARRVLMQPLDEGRRVWLAGEAAHETLWGTVGGAWLSGERAAAAVLQALGPPAR